MFRTTAGKEGCSPSGRETHTALPAERAGRVRLSRKAFRLIVLGLALGDLLFSPLTDPVARRMRAYRSRYAPDVPGGTAFGTVRVLRNFRLFFRFWAPPPGVPRSWRPRDVLTADGNSVVENLAGHFGLAVLMVLSAIALGVPVPDVLIAGTLINVWHEYVAEGLYCDPSWIDLWLDQAGLFTAVAAGAYLRRRRRSHDSSARTDAG